MTENLQQLFRDEAERVAVPPPPVDAIVTDGRRRRTVRRTRGALAVAASVAVLVGGLVAVGEQLTDDASGIPTGPASSVPSPSATTAAGSLAVSGTGVAGRPFGAGRDDVLAAVTADLGEPDLVLGPERYVRIPGSDGWFRTADDPMSPSWAHPVASVTCWRTLCLIFGGTDADSLTLRGWELAQQRRWSEYDAVGGAQQPDVRLAGTGIRLGDSWKRLHAAYPRTVVDGGEGASVTVRSTPWPGVSDGVGAWRLSGTWDYAHPRRAPAGAVVTRLSAGEGPEIGCC